VDLEVGDEMATIRNRQNLTDAEAVNAVEVFDANGRLNTVLTDADNDEIFHAKNTVVSNVGGSSVKNVPAALAAQAAAKVVVRNRRK
jgi:hypothetical protein